MYVLPDISNIDILSSYWKRGKYKISYFPRIQYETLAGVFWREQGTTIILVQEDSGGSDQSRGININHRGSHRGNDQNRLLL